MSEGKFIDFYFKKIIKTDLLLIYVCEEPRRSQQNIIFLFTHKRGERYCQLPVENGSY